MTIQSKNSKNFATLIEKNIEPEKNSYSETENSAALNNNKAVINFLNNKINTQHNIEISKASCTAYKKGIGNKNCSKCVGKCSEYTYIKDIHKRIVKPKQN